MLLHIYDQRKRLSSSFVALWPQHKHIDTATILLWLLLCICKVLNSIRPCQAPGSATLRYSEPLVCHTNAAAAMHSLHARIAVRTGQEH